MVSPDEDNLFKSIIEITESIETEFKADERTIRNNSISDNIVNVHQFRNKTKKKNLRTTDSMLPHGNMALQIFQICPKLYE